MRPVRLEMEGFGAFREPTEIDFAGIDLLALVGDTGSGKSTIIDAITFALYGSVARYDDERAVAPVINQTSTRARVHLELELGGQRYVAARLVQRTKLGATTKEARLERGDEVLAADAKSMTAAVEKLLGLDVEQFNQTVVLPQGRFAEFLHDKPAERQETLRQLLGLGIYDRMGVAARQRAAMARTQIAVLQPDLDAGLADTSDERRAELVGAVERVEAGRNRFRTDRNEVIELAQHVAACRADLADLDARLVLLAEVAAPDHLDDLAARRTWATTELAEATELIEAARASRQTALAAQAAGPDLARCRQHRELRESEATAAAAAHQADELEQAAAAAWQAVRAAAEVVVTDQQRLDAKERAARDAEDVAHQAVVDGPERAVIDRHLAAYDRREDMVATVARHGAALAEAETLLAPLDAQVAAAEAAVATATDEAELAQRRSGVAAHASLLVVGEACPLCTQVVHDLPHHDVDAVLEEAGRRRREAAQASAAARQAAEAARRQRSEAAADHRASHTTLGELDRDLAVAGTRDELTSQAADAQRRADAHAAATSARKTAVLAADAFRGDLKHRRIVDEAEHARVTAGGASAAAAQRRERLAELREQLIDVPDTSVLDTAIATAEALVAAAREADDALDAADRRMQTATSARHAIEGELAEATSSLINARDRVATLEPPAVSATDPVAGWAALAGWATDRRRADEADRPGVDAAVTGARSRHTDADDAIRSRVSDVLADANLASLTLDDLGQRLAAAEADRRNAVARFDEERTRLAALRQRVDGLAEVANVAEETGRRLRADGFEAWLMQAALEELVDAASVRLRELSGGQFSLELDVRDFAVRDHTNADELRSARTLSGGETFLASLALALALADAVAEMAPEGSPTIESIFLDEGFGTLDPTTLDTVAAAIEELGASGRMVGIVTHIRELAERMPTRLDVTKAAGVASVTRVEV